MEMNFKVEGLDRLFKKLDSLGENVEASKEKAELKAAAQLEKRAKENCPVDTDELRNSIHTELRNDGTAAVGTNCGHAAPVEFGTGPTFGDPSVPHTTKEYWRYKDDKGWHTTHGQRPQPYMRTAFAQGKADAIKAAKDSLKEDIEGLMK